MRYVLLLLLASCTSGPSEFHRGTMVAPPPAPARPGVGAPIRGQPGEPHAYPRSPYTRVLPETPDSLREDGLWSGGGPVASTSPLAPVLGVIVPTPQNYESDSDPNAFCAALVEHGGDATPAFARALRALGDDAKRCFVARAMVACMEFRLAEHAPRLATDDGPHLTKWKHAFQRDIQRSLEALRAFLLKKCTPGLIDDTNGLFDTWRIASFAKPPGGMRQ